MNYEERIKKLDSLNKFINGEHQDDILLMLDKEYREEKWSIICAVMHWFRVVQTHLDSEHLLEKNSKDYNWGKVYLFICSVDVIVKGITDINKIIEDNDNCKLFSGENDIFNSDTKDDWNYFQNIRAIFGAHPTDLKYNADYIVATYPTPYSSKTDSIFGEQKDWDYYTLLWSKEKSHKFKQEKFGFKFEDINRYLDKYLNYLDVIYQIIIDKINDYKKRTSNKEIVKKENHIEQLNILIKEDKNRLNGRYGYIIKEVKTLIETKIVDESNKKNYEKYKTKLIEKIPYIYEALQHPDKIKNIDEVENILYCETVDFTNMSSYYYSKLFEYWNNEDMEEVLLEYFKDRIDPFNNNISNIKELFCLVKAFNYYKNFRI